MTQVAALDRKPHSTSQPFVLTALEALEKRHVLAGLELGVIAMFVLVIALQTHKDRTQRLAETASPPIATVAKEQAATTGTRAAATENPIATEMQTRASATSDLGNSFHSIAPPSLLRAYATAADSPTAAPKPVVAAAPPPAALGRPPAAVAARAAPPTTESITASGAPRVSASSESSGGLHSIVPPELQRSYPGSAASPDTAPRPIVATAAPAAAPDRPATAPAGGAALTPSEAPIPAGIAPRQGPIASLDLSRVPSIVPRVLAGAYPGAGMPATPPTIAVRPAASAPAATPTPVAPIPPVAPVQPAEPSQATQPSPAAKPAEVAARPPAPTGPAPGAASPPASNKPSEHPATVAPIAPSASPGAGAPAAFGTLTKPETAPAESSPPATPVKEAKLNPEDDAKTAASDTVHGQKDFDQAFLSASRMLEPRLTPEERAASMGPDYVDAIQRIEGFYDPTRVGPFGTGMRMEIRPGTMSMTDVFGERWTRAYPDPNVHYRVGYHAETWLRPRSHKCEDFWRFRPVYSAVALDRLTPSDCARIRAKPQNDTELMADSNVVAAPLTVPVFAAPYPGSRMTHDELMAALRARADAAHEDLWYGRSSGLVRPVKAPAADHQPDDAKPAQAGPPEEKPAQAGPPEEKPAQAGPSEEKPAQKAADQKPADRTPADAAAPTDRAPVD